MPGELEVGVVCRVVVQRRGYARHARPRVGLDHGLEERRQHAQLAERGTERRRQLGDGREEVEVLRARVRAIDKELGRRDVPFRPRPAPAELWQRAPRLHAAHHLHGPCCGDVHSHLAHGVGELRRRGHGPARERVLSTDHHRLLPLEDIVPIRRRRQLLRVPPSSAAAAFAASRTSTKASELLDRSRAREHEPRRV